MLMRDSYVIARSKLLVLVWGLGFNKVPRTCAQSLQQHNNKSSTEYEVLTKVLRVEKGALRTGYWMGKLVESCSLEAHGFLSLLTNILDPASNGGSIFSAGLPFW
ncbi:uncharacterized protein BDZ83DRAFT_602251 [Colletotrichum acutatum]|uniref:Uncharacterized protein n=1 Tax=Glomerella acutata TaxID=27357 RepID=A0AAD9D1W1_GLOAC|nr:uncharacterized protein BDZ83DRAFT_602251 [Colletotrichum acutatum]KAK1730284.1 hypothetical protein BDZ83DRAFT_602251 [Colletotrichum acutatum]